MKTTPEQRAELQNQRLSFRTYTHLANNLAPDLCADIDELLAERDALKLELLCKIQMWKMDAGVIEDIAIKGLALPENWKDEDGDLLSERVRDLRENRDMFRKALEELTSKIHGRLRTSLRGK